MSASVTQPVVTGTDENDILDGTNQGDMILGLAGDDTIQTFHGDDIVHGDFVTDNLLDGTDGARSFAQYGDSDAWSVATDSSGHTSMTQTIDTSESQVYKISFGLAANYGAASLSGAIEVLWNGVVIDTFDTNSATFEAHDVTFAGIEGQGDLTFRSVESSGPSGPQIQTDTPVYYYEKDMQIGGQTVTVNAIAEGQSHIYQVINGTLQVFDVATGQYTLAGSPATVTVNAIGFNVEDDLIYGIAVGNGVDSLGNSVQRTDLVMLDAHGDSYRIGSTPYRSWTGDFDENGNLWAFQSSMDRVTMIDVDQVDANGDVLSVTYKFPTNMITDQLWDVAYDAESNSFFGITRPPSEGGTSWLYEIDISAVASGGEPTFNKKPITSTVINGQVEGGVPLITFGAAIHDADGNLYAAGNSGDHDMDNSTPSSGGIYRVVEDPDSGAVHLELMASSPRSSSNDGTADPRTADPFAEVDQYASVLIRELSVTPTEGGSNSYDDVIEVGGGADMATGGLGEDMLAGQAGNDTLSGGTGNDALYGGNANPSSGHNGEYYDALGRRFDINGNLLSEENDVLDGGEGNDLVKGAAGHDTLMGGEGNDTLNGGSGFDNLSGGIGRDVMAGGTEQDILRGGDGNDILIGGDGKDQLFGDDGNDNLRGGADADTLTGGLGDDDLDGGLGNDVLIGGAGDDHLKGSTGNDVLSADSGENLLEGGSGNDDLTGGLGVDTLDGGSGNDVLRGGAERDELYGGTGNDVLEGGDDKDKLYGGKGDDDIDGGDGSDYINAGDGDDVIQAGAGRDKVLVGAGSDIVYGGSDSDWFVFRDTDRDGKTNTIMDYTRNGTEDDRLDFRLLDLLSGGDSQQDFIDQNVVQNGDYSVTIDLGGFAVKVLDHDNQQGAFLASVIDGFQL